MKLEISVEEARDLALNLGYRIVGYPFIEKKSGKKIRVYGVPRGGVSVAYLLSSIFSVFEPTDNIEEAHFIIDDLIDSGTTLDRYTQKTEKPFFALIDKRDQEWSGKWIVFPWEVEDDSKEEEEDLIRVIERFGVDAKREEIDALKAILIHASPSTLLAELNL